MKTENCNFTAEEIFNALNKDKEFTDSLIIPQQLDETGEKWGIRIGGKLASDDIFNTKEDAEKYAAQRPMKIIFSLMCAIAEMIYEQKYNTKK